MKNMKDKKLTRRQVKAIILRSGEFDGLSTTNVAKKMGISEQAVNGLLRRAKQVCPSIFPLLTKREADVLALLNLGRSNSYIGEKMDLPDYTVSKIINSLEKKNRGVFNSDPAIMQRYAPHLDNQIREKF